MLKLTQFILEVLVLILVGCLLNNGFLEFVTKPFALILVDLKLHVKLIKHAHFFGLLQINDLFLLVLSLFLEHLDVLSEALYHVILRFVLFWHGIQTIAAIEFYPFPCRDHERAELWLKNVR